MKILSAILVELTLIGTTLGTATDVEARKPRPKLAVKVTGNITAGGGTFSGTFGIERFAVIGDQIHAVGTISGVVTSGAGVTRTILGDEVALPVTDIGVGAEATDGGVIAQQQAPCSVLHLELGAVAVDLLGFQLELSPIMLDIAGGTGPLGELICAVADLLGNVAAVVNLLNQILGLLLGLVGTLVPAV